MANELTNTPSGEPGTRRRASGVTVRSVSLGLAAGAVLAGAGYVNDCVLGMHPITRGYLPAMLYGLLIVSLLTVNPLLRRLRPAWALRPGEWAVVLCLVLASLTVATRGLMRTFAPVLAMPAKHYETQIAWQRARVMSYLPPGLLVNDGRYDEQVIGGYANGPPGTHTTVGLTDVPWHAWAGPFAAWLPIVCFVLVASLSLAVIVHRQWAQREFLKFPIAEFTSTLIHGRVESTFQVGRDVGPARPLLRRPGFWLLFAAAFGIHLVNGLQTWYPNSIRIPLVLNTFGPLYNKFPMLGRTGLAWVAYNGWIFLSVVGFSFFLTREVSLAVGLTPFVHELFMAAMLTYGINPRSGPGVGWYEGFFNIGAFLGITWAILWAGRSTYGPLLARATGARFLAGLVGLARRAARPIEGVWAMRVFLVATAAAVVFLARIGLPWPFAALIILTVLIIQMVVARINVETGLYYYTALFDGHSILCAMLGLYALGPQGLLLAGLFAVVFRASSTVTLMPLVINSLEVCRRQGVSTARVSPWMAAMMLAAIPIGLVAVLWVTYSLGTGPHVDQWALSTPPAAPFHAVSRAVESLAQQGQLAASENLSPLERLGAAEPVKGFVWLALAGFALTILFNLFRQRFPWWPIHPLVLAIWGAWPLAWFGLSFLLGWLVRTMVVKLFGEGAAQRAKPLMIGLIAGELVGLLFWMLVGWVYYLATGIAPKPYGTFAG